MTPETQALQTLAAFKAKAAKQQWTGKGQAWGQKPTHAKLAPKAGELHHYSASQVSTFRDCRRKWAYRYIDGLKTAQNPYAALGSYVHKRLEEYLETGALPSGKGIAIEITKKDGTVKQFSHDDILEIMLPGLKHLPAPGVARTEEKLIMKLDGLGTLIGYIDLQYDENGIPVVGDHKTTSNLRWALTKETIRKDVQCTIYAVYAMEETGSDVAICRWVYYQTSKPKSKKVEAKIHLTELAKSWNSILLDIGEMKALHDSGVTANQVPYDVSACERYGGCPYHNNPCKLTPQERMRSLVKMSSLRERMLNQQKQATPPAPAPETAPPAAEGAGQAVNPPEGNSALERLKAKAQGTTPPPAQEAPPPATETAPPPAAAQVAPETAKPAPCVPDPGNVTGKEQGFTLFIDCIPDHECRNFVELAQPVLDQIKAENGTHYKLIPDLFGGNGALFAEHLGAYMDQKPLDRDLIVTLASPMVRDVIEVLEARASSIVRGV